MASEAGAHNVVRHPEIAVFWGQAFQQAGAVPWDRFWANFPKRLSKDSSAAVTAILNSKHKRDAFQAIVNRSNPYTVSAVEMDHAFPPASPVAEVCRSLVAAGSLNSSRDRQAKADSQSLLLVRVALPATSLSLYGEEAAAASLVSTIQSQQSSHLISLHGPSGSGKLTQAVAAGKALMQVGHWQHAFYADLSGCETKADVCLTLQAAFGVPGDTAGLDLLLTWLRRSELGLMGLIVRLPDNLAAAKSQAAVTGPIKSMIQACSTLQVVVCSTAKLVVESIPQSFIQPAQLNEASVQRLLDQLAPGQGKMLMGAAASSLAELSPLMLQAMGGMTEAAKTDSKKIADCLQGGSADAQKRILTLAVKQLEDLLNLSLGSLAMLPAGFTLQEAALLLDTTQEVAKARLEKLGNHNLLFSDRILQNFSLHPQVRQAAFESVIRQGISQNETRVAMAEHYAEVVKRASAMWEARSPEAAMLLVTRNLPALRLILAWLPQGTAPVDAADAYRDLLWNGGNAIIAWLAAAERITFCQVASKLVDDSIKKGSSSQACAGQIAGALGLAYLEAGQHKEALKSLQQAEKILKACRSAADSPALQALDEARVCTGLADVLVQLGDVEGAHDMLARVYNKQLEQAQLSQEDPAVLATTARSAGIMLAERKFADAVQCYQSVLAGIEKAFGPEAFETAAAAKNVGAALKASSSFDDAERSYRQCISILQKIYGTEHPEVASAMVEMASVLKLMDRPDEAADHLQHALSIYEEALGDTHTSVAAIQQALAELPVH
ncbi:hypothetical protein WJX74_005494 [Apatococcus lobatus]|uniref:Uncharacterized protein n=1 Tax=Apatococcus lobatus TaxID=904363 RepID=A0AAW1SFS7_9CHLO